MLTLPSGKVIARRLQSISSVISSVSGPVGRRLHVIAIEIIRGLRPSAVKRTDSAVERADRIEVASVHAVQRAARIAVEIRVISRQPR